MAHAPTYRLDYEPDDDLAAAEVIDWELRHPRVDRWRALTSDPYLLQTYRVLVAILDTISNDSARRGADIRAVRAAYIAHQISDEERRQAVAKYTTWKASAGVFRSKANQRLRQLVPRVRNMHGDTAYEHVRQALLDLAAAVAAHQTETGGHASTPDRLLYARLDALTVPTSRTFPGTTMDVRPVRDVLHAHTPDPTGLPPPAATSRIDTLAKPPEGQRPREHRAQPRP